MDDPEKKPSIFSALRPKSEEPRRAPPPAAPPAAPPVAPPVAPPAAPPATPPPPPPAVDAAENSALLQRIKLLEARLNETQEKAISAMETLRQTEVAQKLAHTEAEALLNSAAAQRRLEQAESQTRELLAMERRRIEELEQRLVSAVDAGTIEPLKLALSEQEARLASLQAASASAARELALGREETAEARAEIVRARAAAEAAAEAAVRRLRADLEREIAAAVETSQARVSRRADEHMEEKFASIDADRRAERIGVAGETARAREADRKALSEALSGLEKSLTGAGEAARQEFSRFQAEMLRRFSEKEEIVRRLEEKLDALTATSVRRTELDSLRAALAEISTAPTREVTDSLQGISVRVTQAESAMQQRVSRFETEMRAAVYARLLDLERRIKLKE